MSEVKKMVSDHNKPETKIGVNYPPCADTDSLPAMNRESVFGNLDFSTDLINREPVTYTAPSGNAFIISDTLQVVIGDKAPATLCSRLEVVSEGCDKHGRGRCRLVRFTDSFGNSRERVIMLSDLVTNQGKVLASLVDEGLSLYRHNFQGGNNQVAEYISTAPVTRRFTTVDFYGWIELGKSFIVPSATIGNFNGKEIIYIGDTVDAPKYAQAGTLDQWKETIGKNAKHSSRVAFAVCTAFASPLLAFTNEGSGGFHFVGDSSKGKTTSLRAQCSVWAQVLEDAGEMKNTWNATNNGLENLAKTHTDLPLIIDELGQGEGAKLNIEQALYMIGNGAGKSRMTRESKGRPLNQWRTLITSTGELTARELMARSKKGIGTGAEVRLATVQACPEGGHGVFETLPKGVSARALSESFSEDGARFYGTAGPEFIKRLIDDVERCGGVLATKEKISDMMNQWMQDHAKNYDAQIGRVAKRFALVAVAGELATEYGILPWNTGEASLYARECFKSFAENFETSEEKQKRLCMTVLEFVQSYPANFDYVIPPDQTVYKATNTNPLCGSVVYGTPIKAGTFGEPAIVVFTSEGMKRAGGDCYEETIKALKSRKWLITNNGTRRQFKSRTPINVGGIVFNTGYIVIPEFAYPENVRKELEGGRFSDENRHKVGTRPKN